MFTEPSITSIVLSKTERAARRQFLSASRRPQQPPHRAAPTPPPTCESDTNEEKEKVHHLYIAVATANLFSVCFFFFADDFLRELQCGFLCAVSPHCISAAFLLRRQLIGRRVWAVLTLSSFGCGCVATSLFTSTLFPLRGEVCRQRINMINSGHGVNRNLSLLKKGLSTQMPKQTAN